MIKFQKLIFSTCFQTKYQLRNFRKSWKTKLIIMKWTLSCSNLTQRSKRSIEMCQKDFRTVLFRRILPICRQSLKPKRMLKMWMKVWLTKLTNSQWLMLFIGKQIAVILIKSLKQKQMPQTWKSCLTFWIKRQINIRLSIWLGY